MSSLASLNAAVDRIIKSRATAVAKHADALVEFEKKQTEAEAAVTKFLEENKTEAAIAAGLPNGSFVSFEYGRGDTKRVLQGTVLGTKPQDKGAVLYRIKHGTGFDEQIVTVMAPAVLAQLDSLDAAPAVDESVAAV